LGDPPDSPETLTSTQFAAILALSTEENRLMDRATLLAFATQWGEEDRQTLRDLPRLNAEEGALYDDLRDNRLRRNLRLEQERIGFGWVEVALADVA